MRVRLEDLAQHSVAAVLSLVTFLTLIVMTVMIEVLPCVVLFVGLGGQYFFHLLISSILVVVLLYQFRIQGTISAISKRWHHAPMRAVLSCYHKHMIRMIHDAHDTMQLSTGLK